MIEKVTIPFVPLVNTGSEKTVDLKDAVVKMEKLSDIIKKAEFVAYDKVSILDRKYEENDGISQTVQSDWIPIGEQVKMIMRGEITVGNMSDGFDDAFSDLDEESPEEVFEDATDYGTEYSDEIRDAVLAEKAKQAHDSAETKETNEKNDAEALQEATAE